ncbi:hypothetical protein GU927_018385 [Rhodobacteraceae bacterium HSP-20]|uniref:Double Cache domain-containing protein n=1 Tax=Paragemmobacter amnigenus TaxID=2852097 RepID=A0ABS6J897_9RHOB|nr:hypothetical protein [Rhodobacter amnigenus]MBU9699812.1 hypothetical protein [Rhodobacter amnigenus]MBV4391039.1 hypothetical protein [Rhodobacter amnigenus]
MSKAQKTSKGDRSFLGAMVFSICFMGVLAYSYTFLDEVIESVTSSTIRASTESSHGDMVLVASQSLRQEIETLITAYEAVDDNVDWPQFSRAPVFIDFDRKVRALVARTKVVKLKLYADDSITIYSSNPSEIGVEKSEVEQVTHALRGRSSSQVTVRETFSSFEGELRNVDIVSSYHPLQDGKGETIGVVEIYSDRTTEFSTINDYGQTQVGKFLIVLALAMAVWFGQLIFGALRQRQTD